MFHRHISNRANSCSRLLSLSPACLAYSRVPESAKKKDLLTMTCPFFALAGSPLTKPFKGEVSEARQ